MLIKIVEGEQRRRTVRTAVEELGEKVWTRLRLAKQILVVPDMGMPERSLSFVHSDALRGVLDVVRSLTDAPVTVGAVAEYPFVDCATRAGYGQLPEWYPNVTIVDLALPPWKEMALPHGDGVPRSVRRAALAFSADVVIAVAAMKTHQRYGAKLSVATLTEGTWIVPPRRTPQGTVALKAPWYEAEGEQGTHELLAGLFAATPCHLAVVDGILGMEGDGPWDGDPVPMGMVIAGVDAVLTDAVAAALMGMDPQGIGYLQALADRGVGSNLLAAADISPKFFHERARAFRS